MEVGVVKMGVLTKMYREGRRAWSVDAGNQVGGLGFGLRSWSVCCRCAKIKAFSCQAHSRLQPKARN